MEKGTGENWRIIRDVTHEPGSVSVHICLLPRGEWISLPHMSSEKVSRRTMCRDDKVAAAGKKDWIFFSYWNICMRDGLLTALSTIRAEAHKEQNRSRMPTHFCYGQEA